MKYKVNDSCIGCGLCESTCPEVFSIQGDVAVAIEDEVPGAAMASAAEAKEGCPVGAIEEA
ncbi:MAG: ferredoxin [Bacteroidales bacterium]|nr:ferredoxin [Bacteroidales bacterium]MBR0540202.1 ferredoxin [Bacteroidales bacterium]